MSRTTILIFFLQSASHRLSDVCHSTRATRVRAASLSRRAAAAAALCASSRLPRNWLTPASCSIAPSPTWPIRRRRSVVALRGARSSSCRRCPYSRRRASRARTAWPHWRATLTADRLPTAASETRFGSRRVASLLRRAILLCALSSASESPDLYHILAGIAFVLWAYVCLVSCASAPSLCLSLSLHWFLVLVYSALLGPRFAIYSFMLPIDHANWCLVERAAGPSELYVVYGAGLPALLLLLLLVGLYSHLFSCFFPVPFCYWFILFIFIKIPIACTRHWIMNSIWLFISLIWIFSILLARIFLTC